MKQALPRPLDSKCTNPPVLANRSKFSYLAAVEHQLRLAQVADTVSLTHVGLGPVQYGCYPDKAQLEAYLMPQMA